MFKRAPGSASTSISPEGGVNSWTEPDFEGCAKEPLSEIGEPHSPFTDSADQVTGAVLVAGCWTGEIALFLVANGCKMPGVGFRKEPTPRAMKKRPSASRRQYFWAAMR